MNIAFLCKNQAVFESSFAPTARALLKRGHTVAAFYSPGEYAPQDKSISFFPCRWWNFELLPLKQFAADTVVIFNGSFPWCAAASRAIASEWRTLFVELGWLPQRGYSYMDTQGAGARSALAENGFRDMAANYGKYSLLARLVRGRYTPNTPPSNLPKDYVLVPLQLEEDTSILYDSPNFKTMESLLGFIRWHFADMPIVVKPHPLSPHVPDLSGVYAADPRTPFNDLVPGARLVAGINSTTLIEALVHYKPVLALGKNVASGLGVFYEGLHALWNPRDALTFQPSPPRVDMAISWLRSKQYRNAKPTKRVLDLIAGK